MTRYPDTRTIRTEYAGATDDIRRVRDEVFIREQSVPPELEFDDRDDACRHVVAYRDDLPVATGRIDLEREGKIGRVAVVSTERRRGIGRLVMAELENVAREAGLARVTLHAQVTAAAFYERLGYAAQGDEFEEAGIPHVAMHKDL